MPGRARTRAPRIRKMGGANNNHMFHLHVQYEKRAGRGFTQSNIANAVSSAAGRFARRWVVVAGSCVSWTGEAARDAGARDLRAATAVAVEGDDVVLDGTTRFRAADALRRDVWAAALRAAVARAPAGGPGDVAVAVAPLPRFPGYVDVRARRGGLRASRFVAVEAVTTDLDARLGALAEDECFERVYGFAYVPEMHRGSFDVLLHRARAALDRVPHSL